MFECWWQNEGFEAWRLDGDLRGASRRWQHRLHDELWLWFNDSGEGVVWGKNHGIFLKPGLFGCFGGGEGEDWKWTRLPGQHAGQILIVPRDWLTTRCGAAGAGKRTPFSRWLRGECGVAFVGLMGGVEKKLATRLAAGWKSRTLPPKFAAELQDWVSGLLGSSPAAMPRASACGRRRTSTQVSSTKPMSYHSQSTAGM
jgi:hypothetical protein